MCRGLCLLVSIIGVVWLSCEVEVQRREHPPAAVLQWRRTARGWEHQAAWRDDSSPALPALHPLIVASLQLLFSLAALVAVTQPWERMSEALEK